VLVSGINAVMVARFPAWQQGDSGAFFFCGEYFAMMQELRERSCGTGKLFGRRGRRDAPAIATLDDLRHDVDTVIGSAAELTLRQLDIWQRMAGPDTRISYVLQPMTRWMDRTPAAAEQELFDENDRGSDLGVWEEAYAEIATKEFGQAYAAALRTGCDKQGVRFLDLNPAVGAATGSQDWMFVDRVHYTDVGHDIVARMMAEALELT
jgi:hypothetical protein